MKTDTKLEERIDIREYQDSDYEDVKLNLRDAEMYDSNMDSKEGLRRKIEFNSWSVFVATHDNHAIGNVYFRYNRQDSYIFLLVVRKDYRRQGIGTSLMNEAHKKLKEAGAKRVALRIREEGGLLEYLKRYYSKMGYSQSQDIPRLMWKSLE